MELGEKMYLLNEEGIDIVAAADAATNDEIPCVLCITIHMYNVYITSYINS